MSKIFITGSADGLGLLSAKEFIRLGHEVVLHARNDERAKETLKNVRGALAVLTGDLSDIQETIALAKKVNETGYFDVVIHNAGLYRNGNGLTKDGLPQLFAVNSIAPYILTCLIQKPRRLIYLSSGMHRQGNPDISNLSVEKIKRNFINYSDTKLHDLILAKATAAKWPDVYSNAVDPGWVPTKMGGPGAPDNLQEGFATQVWLAISNEPAACVSGRYFHHKKEASYLKDADNSEIQTAFIALAEKITGISFFEKK